MKISQHFNVLVHMSTSLKKGARTWANEHYSGQRKYYIVLLTNNCKKTCDIPAIKIDIHVHSLDGLR